MSQETPETPEPPVPPETPRPLPADRAKVLTERRNERSMKLHAMSAGGIVRLINEEDRAVHLAMDEAAGAITAFIEAVEGRFSAGGRLIYLGAGTSGRLGVLDASEAPPTFQIAPDRIIGIIAGGDASLRKSSESKEDGPEGAREELEKLALTDRDSVLGIASGGTTPYVHGALRIAREMAGGCVTGFLTCTELEKTPYIDHLIFLKTGPEVLTGSTRMKAGTATKLALNIISTTLMIRSGRVYENLMVDMRASNQKLMDRAARIVSTLTGLARPEAFTLLQKADGQVKPAIVMQRLGIDFAQAQRKLAAAGGRLDVVLGE